MTDETRHCEERSDEAIQLGGANWIGQGEISLDCFASLAMTDLRVDVVSHIDDIDDGRSDIALAR
jgi:hypothetical protein